MTTKIEQFSLELRSVITGLAQVQVELDNYHHEIIHLKNKIKEKDAQIEVISRAGDEAARLERWQRVASDTPPEGIKILMKDNVHKLWLAEYAGAAGWFVGDTRLKSTPVMWMRIPSK